MMSQNIRRNKTPVAIFIYESLVDNTSATELNPAFCPSRFVETNRRCNGCPVLSDRPY